MNTAITPNGNGESASKSPFGLKVLFGEAINEVEMQSKAGVSKSPFGLKVLFGSQVNFHNCDCMDLSKSPFGLKVLFGKSEKRSKDLAPIARLNHLSV